MTENVAGIFSVLLNRFFVHHVFTFNSRILVRPTFTCNVVDLTVDNRLRVYLGADGELR